VAQGREIYLEDWFRDLTGVSSGRLGRGGQPGRYILRKVGGVWVQDSYGRSGKIELKICDCGSRNTGGAERRRVGVGGGMVVASIKKKESVLS